MVCRMNTHPAQGCYEQVFESPLGHKINSLVSGFMRLVDLESPNAQVKRVGVQVPLGHTRMRHDFPSWRAQLA